MSTLFSHFFQKINQISPLEHNFTEVLESIAVKPKTLYFYGKLPENMSKNQKIIPKLQNDNKNKSSTENRTSRPKTVAIVGSRHNTRYGEEIAHKMSYELAKRGAVIVSGLAYGIDSIAHRAALDAGGTTVAILGTPIDKIYPKNHLKLAEDIIKNGGAIISEYAPGEMVHHKVSFLERNRIISGLSDIVVVVEAAERSGSLNTATHAINQGKDVFAVPGNITNPYSKGCNKLISQGAFPYIELDDMLRILFPEEFIKKKHSQLKLIGDNDIETAILKSISVGINDGDDIMNNINIPPEVFNQSIILLEIKNRIKSTGYNKWILL